MKLQLTILLFFLGIQLSSSRQLQQKVIDVQDHSRIDLAEKTIYAFTASQDTNIVILDAESLTNWNSIQLIISKDQEFLNQASNHTSSCVFEYSRLCLINQWGNMHLNDIIYFKLKDISAEIPHFYVKVKVFKSKEDYQKSQVVLPDQRELFTSYKANETFNLQLSIQQKGFYHFQAIFLNSKGNLNKPNNLDIKLEFQDTAISNEFIRQGWLMNEQIYFCELNIKEIHSKSNHSIFSNPIQLRISSSNLSEKSQELLSLHTSLKTVHQNIMAGTFGEVITIPLQINEQDKNIFSSNGILLSDYLLLSQSKQQEKNLIAKFEFMSLESNLLPYLNAQVYSSLTEFKQNQSHFQINQQNNFQINLPQASTSSIVLQINLLNNNKQINNSSDTPFILLRGQLIQLNQISQNNEEIQNKKDDEETQIEIILGLAIFGTISLIGISILIYVKCTSSRNPIIPSQELVEEVEENNEDQQKVESKDHDYESNHNGLKKPMSTKSSTKTNGNHMELAQDDDKSANEIIEKQETIEGKSRRMNGRRQSRKGQFENEQSALSPDKKKENLDSYSNNTSNSHLQNNDKDNLLEKRPKTPLRMKNRKEHLQIQIEDSSFDPSQNQQKQLSAQQQLQYKQRQLQIRQQQRLIQQQKQMMEKQQQQQQQQQQQLSIPSKNCSSPCQSQNTIN